MIVSQSLTESRQTIHRRRAETSSLKGCSPSSLKPSPRPFSIPQNEEARADRSMLACVYFIPHDGPVSSYTPISLSLPLPLSRSFHLFFFSFSLLLAPFPCSPLRCSSFDDGIANWPITLIEKKAPTQNQISSYEHPRYSGDTAIPIALIATHIWPSVMKSLATALKPVGNYRYRMNFIRSNPDILITQLRCALTNNLNSGRILMSFLIVGCNKRERES